MALTKINTDALSDNAVTLAKMASGTDGEILTYDASGNPVAVSVGTDGQVLTSTGAGSPPAFEAAAGGGKVLQMVSSNTTSGSVQDAGSSWGDLADMTITITPTASTSTIHFTFYAYAHINGSQSSGVRVLRGSTSIKENVNWSGYNTVSGWNPYPVTVIGTDTPNTTNATTYKLQVKTTGGTSRYFESSTSSFGELTCIAIEIGA